MPGGCANRSKVIPEDRIDDLVALYGTHDPTTQRRRTYRDLSRWLLNTHGVQASPDAIRHVVEPMLRERAAIRRDLLRERLAAALDDQVDVLDKLMAKVAGLAKGKRVSAKVLCDALDEYRKAIETKSRFAGVGERVEHGVDTSTNTDDVQTSDARRELAEALAREAAVALRRRAGGGAGEPPDGGG